MPELAIAPPDVVFVIGNGATKNGWKPVIDAINSVAHVGIENGEEANFWLATHVFLRRMVYASLPLRAKPSEHERAKADSDRNDLTLKNAIAAMMSAASADGTLSVQSSLYEALANPRFAGNRVFLTANWDLLLEKTVKEPKAVLHLHGTAERGETLFLPSETTDEPFRKPEERDRMARFVATLWQAIARTPKLCIVGLSLSALDAEIAYTVGVGLKEHAERGTRCEVTIYDLAGPAIESVARRVELLTNGSSSIAVRLERQKV